MSLINDSQTSPEAMETPMGARNVGYQEETPVSMEQYIGAVFAGGPASSIYRSLQRDSANFDAQSESGAATEGYDVTGTQKPPLSADEANERYGPIGPDGKKAKITDKPIYDEVAKVIGGQKADEMDRNAIIDRYSGQHTAVQNFGVGMVGFMLDPLNAASTFIPGVGEETTLAGMGRVGLATTGILARTGARVVAGATAGAISQAPLTALKYGLDQQQASDYDLRSAAKDVLYAAAGNAIIHAGFFGGLHEAGILKPDAAMRYQDQIKTASPEIQSIINADATSKHAAMQAAVGQMTEGREVNVEPIFPKSGEENPQTVAEIAQKEAQTYRDGFSPGMTGAQIEIAKNEILPEATEEKPVETSPRLDQKVIDRYKKTISDEAARIGIPIDDTVLNKAASVMAESHNPEAPPGKPLSLKEVEAGAKVENSPFAEKPAAPEKTFVPVQELPKLPKELSKGSPRYKQSEISFESDVDKALYIVRERSTGKSKAHDKYMDYLKNDVGLSDAEIRQGSEKVKNAIQAHTVNDGEKITLPKTFTPEQKTIVVQPKQPFRQKSPMDAIQLAASLGGLKDEGGELAAMGADKHFVPGRGRLVRGTGQSIDDFGRQLVERGYVKERPTTAETLEIIRDGINGKKTFSEADRSKLEQANAKEQKSAYNEDLERHAGEMGIDTKDMTPEQIEDSLRAATKQAADEKNFAEAQEKYKPEESEHANETLPLETYAEHLENGPAGEERPGTDAGSAEGGAESGTIDAGTSQHGEAGATEPHPDDVTISELESKLDFAAMTDEEKAALNEVHANAEAANDVYQQKLREYAACLAENG